MPWAGRQAILRKADRKGGIWQELEEMDGKKGRESRTGVVLTTSGSSAAKSALEAGARHSSAT
jgi:hypothetical protein